MKRLLNWIPGLQNIRQKTLPQMYFEACSVFRGTYGRVNPLFSHPEDAVMIIWKPGEYGKIYFRSCHSCIHTTRSFMFIIGV